MFAAVESVQFFVAGFHRNILASCYESMYRTRGYSARNQQLPTRSLIHSRFSASIIQPIRASVANLVAQRLHGFRLGENRVILSNYKASLFPQLHLANPF